MPRFKPTVVAIVSVLAIASLVVFVQAQDQGQPSRMDQMLQQRVRQGQHMMQQAMMQQLGQQIQQVQHDQARLSLRVQAMNSARGNDRIGAMIAVINELANQHQAMLRGEQQRLGTMITRMRQGGMGSEMMMEPGMMMGPGMQQGGENGNQSDMKSDMHPDVGGGR